MTVTVCIPVYNNFEYVSKTVASVRAQTVQPLELLVIDDGSTIPYEAPPGEGIQEQVIRVSHRGPQNIWNTALMLAKGEWLLNLASDDWLNDDFIEKALAQSEGADVVCVSMQQHGTHDGFVAPGPVKLEEVWVMNPYPYCALYRVETLRRMGGWNGQLEAFCDWGMWIDLLQRNARFAFAPDAIFNYLRHPQSHSSSLGDQARFTEWMRLIHFYDFQKGWQLVAQHA